MFIMNTFRKLELYFAITLLLVLVALVMHMTVMRYIGRPPIWSLEIIQGLFAWTCFVAADVAFHNSSHFGIDAFHNIIPKTLAKYVKLIQTLLIFALLSCLLVYSYQYLMQTKMRTLPATGISFAWVAAGASTGIALMLITTVENIKNILFSKEDSVSDTEITHEASQDA